MNLVVGKVYSVIRRKCHKDTDVEMSIVNVVMDVVRKFVPNLKTRLEVLGDCSFSNSLLSVIAVAALALPAVYFLRMNGVSRVEDPRYYVDDSAAEMMLALPSLWESMLTDLDGTYLFRGSQLLPRRSPSKANISFYHSLGSSPPALTSSPKFHGAPAGTG